MVIKTLLNVKTEITSTVRAKHSFLEATQRSRIKKKFRSDPGLVYKSCLQGTLHLIFNVASSLSFFCPSWQKGATIKTLTTKKSRLGGEMKKFKILWLLCYWVFSFCAFPNYILCFPQHSFEPRRAKSFGIFFTFILCVSRPGTAGKKGLIISHYTYLTIPT